MSGKSRVADAKAVHPLVQYIEVWMLDDERQSLRLHSHGRICGDLEPSDASVLRLKDGEGPAGMAWHQRQAIMLQEAPSELLTRIGAKKGVELAALIAFPVLQGQQTRAVVVLGIGPGPGAFEVWQRDDRDELSVTAGFYSGLKKFEFISRFVKFPKGAGLPGSVWKSGEPGIASDLPNSARFMRSFSADEAELNTGLGLPIGSSAGNADSVLLFLSSHAKPIAGAFEVWKPDVTSSTAGEAELRLRISQADYGLMNPDRFEPSSFVECDSAITECWTSGLPVFSTALSVSLSSRHAVAEESGLSALLAVPVFRGTERTAVVVMLF